MRRLARFAPGVFIRAGRRIEVAGTAPIPPPGEELAPDARVVVVEGGEDDRAGVGDLLTQGGDDVDAGALHVADRDQRGVVLGLLEYSPDLNFTGTDANTYNPNVGSVDSNTADIDVTVSAVNDAPVSDC